MSNKTGKLFPGAEGTEVIQLHPSRHPFVKELWLAGVSNFWTPLEAPMTIDKQQLDQGKLSDQEVLLLKRWTGLTSAGESLVANNILLVFLTQIGDPECQQYLGKQFFEELIHNWTVLDITSTMGFSVEEAYEAYKNVPSVNALTEFLKNHTNDFTNLILDKSEMAKFISQYTDHLANKEKDIEKYLDQIMPDVSTIEGIQKVIKDLVVFYIFTEGILFFSSFAMILAFKQRGLLPGLCKQVEYTQRDEELHVKFGTYVINTLRAQRPEVFTPEFENEIRELLLNAIKLANDFMKDALPDGIIGLRSDYLVKYVEFLANIRSEDIGIPLNLPQKEHPLPWLREIAEMRAETNFFESRVTEYNQIGAIEDSDDF
jgi:ribonucleoside-diphosphate reductase beta chain